MKRIIFSLFAISLGVVLLTGCPPKKKLPIEGKPAEEVKKPEETAPAEQPLKENEVKITQEWTDVPALGMVHFPYDSSSLEATERVVLKKNVAILKKLPKTITVRVEGHCDDRGTVEYNIALGQRRATAVQSYYVTAGMAKSRVQTISFGEERPLCTEATEECWAQNRRDTTKLRNPEPIVINTEELK